MQTVFIDKNVSFQCAQDKVNRRVIMDILIEHAQNHPQHQYTFLTPLGMDNIKETERLKIFQYVSFLPSNFFKFFFFCLFRGRKRLIICVCLFSGLRHQRGETKDFAVRPANFSQLLRIVLLFFPIYSNRFFFSFDTFITTQYFLLIRVHLY